MYAVVLGEALNFSAYAYAPAILVTPLGALSIIFRYLFLCLNRPVLPKPHFEYKISLAVRCWLILYWKKNSMCLALLVVFYAWWVLLQLFCTHPLRRTSNQSSKYGILPWSQVNMSNLLEVNTTWVCLGYVDYIYYHSNSWLSRNLVPFYDLRIG